MSDISDADRITDLEIIAAHQARTIEDLSSELARQGQAVERLQKTLRALGERFLTLEEASAPAPENARPPHY